MKGKIVLDTNFILTCVKQKIDFIDGLEGYELLLPDQVEEELEKLSSDKKKTVKERQLALVSISIVKAFDIKFKKIKLEGKFVDKGLKKLRGKDFIIASLDREIKKALKGKNKFVIIKKRKKLEIE